MRYLSIVVESLSEVSLSLQLSTFLEQLHSFRDPLREDSTGVLLWRANRVELGKGGGARERAGIGEEETRDWKSEEQ